MRRNTGIKMTKRNKITLLKIKLLNLGPLAELRLREIVKVSENSEESRAKRCLQLLFVKCEIWS